MTEEKPIVDLIGERLASHIGASADSLQKVKFGRGAVGKIAVIISIAVLALGAIGVRVGGHAGLAIGGGIVIVALAALGLILYIVMNRPELAVLEGAELIMYKHYSLAAKGFPTLPVSPPIPDPAGPAPQANPPQEPEK